MQGELPARLGVLLRRFARRLHGIVGNPGQLGLVFDDQTKIVGRIEQVFLEPGGQRRQLLLDRLEARLFVLGQFRAAQPEIAHFVVDDFLARGGQRFECRGAAQGLEFPKQRQVLRQVGVVGGDLGQILVVHLAQLRAVHHRIQVRNLAPGARQALVGIFQRLHETVPARYPRFCRQPAHQSAVFRQQGIHRRRDVFGFDFGETGQAGKVEQRIHG